MKECVKCGSQDFIPNGKYTRCRPCLVNQRKVRYKKNKSKILVDNKKWFDNNPGKANEYKKRWKENNPDKDTAARKGWKENNKDRIREYCANRRAAKKNATPPWADRKEIKYVYKLAKERGLVVDHIVPINSDIVCGLHVADNLRAIPEPLNSFKGNRYWPDMPERLSKGGRPRKK